MFSNDNELKKYLYLISYAGIILAIILNLSSVFSFIQYLWQLIIPFIVGFCIAFILNIITNQLEKSLLIRSVQEDFYLRENLTPSINELLDIIIPYIELKKGVTRESLYNLLQNKINKNHSPN